jgi:hypothetical protein
MMQQYDDDGDGCLTMAQAKLCLARFVPGGHLDLPNRCQPGLTRQWRLQRGVHVVSTTGDDGAAELATSCAYEVARCA